MARSLDRGLGDELLDVLGDLLVLQGAVDVGLGGRIGGEGLRLARALVLDDFKAGGSRDDDRLAALDAFEALHHLGVERAGVDPAHVAAVARGGGIDRDRARHLGEGLALLDSLCGLLGLLLRLHGDVVQMEVGLAVLSLLPVVDRLHVGVGDGVLLEVFSKERVREDLLAGVL